MAAVLPHPPCGGPYSGRNNCATIEDKEVMSWLDLERAEGLAEGRRYSTYSVRDRSLRSTLGRMRKASSKPFESRQVASPKAPPQSPTRCASAARRVSAASPIRRLELTARRPRHDGGRLRRRGALRRTFGRRRPRCGD